MKISELFQNLTFVAAIAAFSIAVTTPASAESMPFEIAAAANLRLCQHFVSAVGVASTQEERQVTFSSGFSEVTQSTEILAEKIAEYPELADTDAGDKVLSCLSALQKVKVRYGL